MNKPLLSWHYVALFSLLLFGAPASAQLKLNQAQNSQTTAVSVKTDRTETSSDDHSSGAVHTSPFDAVKDKKEDMAKRDAFSKKDSNNKIHLS